MHFASRTKPYLSAVSVAVALMAGGIASQAADSAGSIQRFDPAEIEHRPIPAFPGVANAFLLGAFDRPGLYMASGKMDQGSTFPPHRHPDTRISVVTSGTMYLGHGEAFDESKLVAYPAGTLAITPPDTPHFMAAKDGDVTILEIGAGPSGATFTSQ